LKRLHWACINLGTEFVTDFVPEELSNPGSQGGPRGSAIIAAGLLLAALALVVLYTTRRAFLSPVALVVVAAIGVAALLLQRRLNPSVVPGTAASTKRGPLWLNVVGVVFAAGAVCADAFHLSAGVMLIAALAAVVSFAASGVMVLSALRKRRL
jgi:hypothetical protein